MIRQGIKANVHSYNCIATGSGLSRLSIWPNRHVHSSRHMLVIVRPRFPAQIVLVYRGSKKIDVSIPAGKTVAKIIRYVFGSSIYKYESIFLPSDRR